MNFLKKIGAIVLKIIGLWTGFAPLAGQLYKPGSTADKVVDTVSQAFGVIGTVEQMFTAAYGPDTKLPSQKLAAALPFVAQVIQQTDLLTGKKPKDETMFTAGVTDFTNALVKILNSYGE